MAIKLVGETADTPTVEDHRWAIVERSFEIGHVASLLKLMAEHLKPVHDSDQAKAWNTVDYLAGQLLDIGDAIDKECDGIEQLERRARAAQ